GPPWGVWIPRRPSPGHGSVDSAAVDPELFLSDIEEKPERLRALADALDDAPVWGPIPPGTRRVVLLGMGSSRYAAAVVAARLLALEDRLQGRDISRVPTICRRAADATEDLLGRRDAWLPEIAELLTATGQAFVLAPHERLSSAEQGALMLREGPRIPADACETADWLHVDVYLTRSLDYRALLFAGSRFDGDAMGWMRDRGATVCAVGGDLPDAKATVRYAGDDDADVAVLSEVVVPELVAADVWRRG